MGLFPTSIDFFEIFDKALANLTIATEHLVDLFKNIGNADKTVKAIYDCEHEGDILTHEIMKELNKTFLTPIDREDIHALAARIDDVLDLIWSGADRVMVYKITEPTVEAMEIAEDLLLTARTLQKALEKLRAREYSHVQEYCIEINRLENRVDRKFRDALGKLVNDSTDAIYVIKWKDVYQHLEDSADKCEDIANILEAIVLKHA